jgi:uncharacterized protein YjdB
MSGAGITAAFGSVVSAPAFVFLGGDCLVSIAVDPDTATLCVGSLETVALTAMGTLTDGSAIDLTSDPAMTWSSSSTTVATISNEAGSQGVAATVAVGSTTVLTAIAETTCMTEADVTWGSSWTSSDPTIASVASGGVVTGVSPGGPVAITASFWMLSDAASVTVVP